MLTKGIIRRIRSLEYKKHRDALNCFVAEGPKLAEAMLDSGLRCLGIYALAGWIADQPSYRLNKSDEIVEITQEELSRISGLKTPNQVLLIMQKPDPLPTPEPTEGELILALEDIQDPGNLGTILRLASWFGIRQVICSPDSADVFSPKTIQSTMGAILSVQVHKTDLYPYLLNIHEKKPRIPIYGASLDGEDLYLNPPLPFGILIMGNESRGISRKIQRFIDHKLLIPCYSEQNKGLESLNVSIATAIICAEFKRLAR